MIKMMRTNKLLPLLIFFITINIAYGQKYQEMILEGTYTFEEIQKEANSYFEDRDKGRGTGYNQWKRWEHRSQMNLNADGTVRTSKQEYEEILSYNKKANDLGLYDNSSRDIGDWESRGPVEVQVSSGYNPGIGRITSLSVDVSDDSHIIAGAVAGGVWKTTDGGISWNSLSDDFVNLNVYALAIAPSNPSIYYWGSSSGLFFKSTDGGSTWIENNIPLTSRIISIAIHPENEDILLASDGIQVAITEDGGISWTKTGIFIIYDIEFHPTDFETIYMSGNKAYKSVDLGATWNELDLPESAQNGVKMMAVTPAAPENVYMIRADDGAFGGYFLSEDGGESFTKYYQGDKNLFGGSSDGFGEGGQAPRDMDISVSHQDANIVFISGINIHKSTDKGETFNTFSHWYLPGANSQNLAYSHADIDITLIVGEKMFIGSDGGVYVLTDVTLPPSNFAILDITADMDIHQIYRLGVAQSEEEKVAIGSQDNGSCVLIDSIFLHYWGGDGMDAVILDNAENTIIGESQYGFLVRSRNNGASIKRLTNSPGLEEFHGNGNWVTPIIKGTQNDNFYVGYSQVVRSTDLGNTFTSISPDFTGSNISDLTIAPTDNDIILATVGSEVYKTTDGGEDWSKITGIVGATADIAFHPNNSDLIAMAKGGQKVILSRDGGETWESYSEGLPSSIQCVIWQNDDTETLYAGSNMGVFVKSKNDDMWLPFSNGLPSVSVNELEINYVTNILYAATYGRGLWSTEIKFGPTGVDDQDLQLSKVILSPNPVANQQKLQIQTSELIKGQLDVFDSSGRIIFKQRDAVISNGDFLDWSPQSSGIYYVRISNSDGIRSIKIISQ